jgi:hypothetical protein
MSGNQVVEKDLGLLESADFIEKQLLEAHAVLDIIMGTDPPMVGEAKSESSLLICRLAEKLKDNRQLASMLLGRLGVLRERF